MNKRPKIIIDQVMQMYDVNTIWSSSGLSPKDVIFVSKSHNIEQNDYYDIKNAGMEFISLANSIGKGLEIPFYLPQYSKFVEKIKYIKKGNKIFEKKIVDQYAEDFISEKRYWSDMFNIVGAKIYITCHKWDYHPIAAAAAMHDNGGISAFFPTSYYEFPCPDGSVYADVFFSFSPKALDIEIRHGSLIRYNVCVGNISQSRNKSFIDSASKLRNKLQNQGAVKIISFFDQSIEVQSKYTFWFEKILKEDWLGLIIKPKRPRLLRKNLGDVSRLMDKAIETGRCHIFLDHESYHIKNFRNPPAEAAMASDVAIHDALVAGTAGMEAALTGTPTLMLDTYGWNRSQIYKLGVGKVVFHDWETLWDALVEHWKGKPIPGFGDWSPILDDLDPFRDGKAAERMGTYLRWCNEGYISGLNRQAILERANEKYGSTWGSDKITFLDQCRK